MEGAKAGTGVRDRRKSRGAGTWVLRAVPRGSGAAPPAARWRQRTASWAGASRPAVLRPSPPRLTGRPPSQRRHRSVPTEGDEHGAASGRSPPESRPALLVIVFYRLLIHSHA